MSEPRRGRSGGERAARGGRRARSRPGAPPRGRRRRSRCPRARRPGPRCRRSTTATRSAPNSTVGVVAEVAHDVADVEPRGQVGRDAAKRLRAPEPAARLLGGVDALDQDAQGPRDRARQPMAIVTTELHGARDDQDPPRMLAAGDADDELVGAHAQDRRRIVGAGPGVDGLGRLEGLGEQVASRRHRAPGGDAGSLDVGRARDQAARPELPDADQRRPGRDADAVARLVERRVHAAREGRDLREVREEVNARRRVAERPFGQVRAAAHRAAGHARLGDRGRGVRRRRREEPLQVDEPVATVATVVDPVVAEPAGLAPGPDRVRMHPQHVRRLRHRQRRIARAGSPGAGRRNVGFGKHRWCGAVPCGAGLVPSTFHHFTRVANSPIYPSIGSCCLPGRMGHARGPAAGRVRSVRAVRPRWEARRRASRAQDRCRSAPGAVIRT